MNHYILELALWTLAIFLIGCVIGYLARRLLRGDETLEPPATADVQAEGTKNS